MMNPITPIEGLTKDLTTNHRLSFRPLYADEVNVCIVETKDGQTITLLLYPKTHCILNILDTTLGPTAWQREYYEAAGLLFCKLGIYEALTNQWLWKSGTCSDSNVEKNSTLAEESFRRAATAWGIGRELFSAPTITIDLREDDLSSDKVTQTFYVDEIEANEGVISKLTILDERGIVRFSYPSSVEEVNHVSFSPSISFTAHRSMNRNEEALRTFCERKKYVVSGDEIDELVKFYDYYMGPDEGNPQQSKIARWEHLSTDKLWERWLANGNKFKKR